MAVLDALNARLDINHRLLQRSYRTPWLQTLRGLVEVTHWRTKRRRRRALEPLALPPAVAAAAAQLRREGYAPATTLADPGLMAAMIARGRALAAATPPVRHGHKVHWQQLLPPEELADPASPFLCFALQPELLGLLALALGEAPRLRAFSLHRSLPSPSNRISQLWHRDYDGLEVLKIFAYLTDVTDPDDGPFTFFPIQACGTWRRWGRNHLEDREVFARLDPAGRRAMLGPAGTVFAVNTHRCLHMGSRLAEGRERLMVTCTYVPAPSLYIGERAPCRPRPEAAALEQLALQ
jgi:hypothetical protein